MDPNLIPSPAKDPAQRREAERYVSTAKNLLLTGNPERCWQLVIKALCVDPCAPGGNAVLVAATALRATNHRRLPSGAPEPYAVFGLDPAVPTARNPVVIESYYRQASDLLNRCHSHDPCFPAFATAARLVADAWAFLSDPDRKASLDSRFEALDSGFEAAATAAAPIPTAPLQPAPQLIPPPPPQPAPPPPPPAQAGPDDMGRGKRSKRPVKKMNL